jgi:hypothetical protein
MVNPPVAVARRVETIDVSTYRRYFFGNNEPGVMVMNVVTTSISKSVAKSRGWRLLRDKYDDAVSADHGQHRR